MGGKSFWKIFLTSIFDPLAEQLFGVGLFGASMLAAAVLLLATAYAVTEAIGFERGVSFSFREAPFFMGLFTSLIVLGTVVAMIPGIPVVTLLLFVQTVNGVLLPIELIFIMLLVNDLSRADDNCEKVSPFFADLVLFASAFNCDSVAVCELFTDPSQVFQRAM